MSTATLELPFELGQKLWITASCPREMTVPCPVCAGKRAVTVILGDGERVDVACDACGLGHQTPQGTVTQYEYTPAVEPFVIAAVRSMDHDGEWVVASDDGKQARFSSLHPTEAEAMAAAEKRAAIEVEQNMKDCSRKRGDVSKYGWSVRYHRDQIRKAEKTIAWHRTRIQAAKDADVPVPAPVETIAGTVLEDQEVTDG